MNVDKLKQKPQLTQVNIVDETGKVTGSVSGKEKVLPVIREHWEKLFKSQKNKPQETELKDQPWFKTQTWQTTRSKMAEHGHVLRDAITLQELEKALQRTKNNKSPGEDGIPMECIKFADKTSKQILCEIYNYLLENGEDLPFWKKTIIFTLHKGENPYLLNNWRPISLLNTRYKLFTKIINTRLYNLLEQHKILSPNQGGWRKKIATHDKILTLIGIIADAKANNKELHLLYIDLKKAFDSIEHWHIESVLAEMGLPAMFIRLIMKLNLQNTSEVITPYGNTKGFLVERSVRQGCPMSPLIFSICIEPLFHWLNENAKGYMLKNQNIPGLGYADDMVLMSENLKDLQETAFKLQLYCDTYGLKINIDSRDKSVYTSTTNRPTDALYSYESTRGQIKMGKPYPKIGSDECYKYLGIPINLQLDWTELEKNCRDKLSRQLNYIRMKCFDSSQATIIINKVFIPALLYRIRVAPVSDSLLKECDNLIASVIYRKMYLPRNTGKLALALPAENNGFAITNLEYERKRALTSSILRTLNGRDMFARLAVEQLITTNDTYRHCTKGTGLKIYENPAYQDQYRYNVRHYIDNETWNAIQDQPCCDIRKLFPNNTFVQINEFKGIYQYRHATSPEMYKLIHYRLQHRLCERETDIPKADLQIILQCQKCPYIPGLSGLTPDPDRDESILIWTDGSRIKLTDGTWRTSLGIHFAEGSNLNQSLRFDNMQSVLEAEFKAIELALRIAPLDKHIKLFTDSETAIKIINKVNEEKFIDTNEDTYRKYALRIIHLIEDRQKLGRETTIHWVYSHLVDSDEEIDVPDDEEEDTVQQSKLRLMIERYGGNTLQVLKGNKQADERAQDASRFREKEPEPSFNTNQPKHCLGRSTTNFDPTKPDKLLQQTLAQKLLRKYKNNKKHDTFSPTEDVDIKASAAIFTVQDRQLNKIKNFIFKVRQEKLPVKARIQKDIQRRIEQNTVDWWVEQRQEKYTDDKCPVCKVEPETILHVLSCQATMKQVDDLKSQIIELLNEGCNGQKLKDFATWFDLTPRADDIRNFPAELGRAGYLPKAFRESLKQLEWIDETKYDKICNKIAILVAKHLYERWQIRNRMLSSAFKGTDLREAQRRNQQNKQTRKRRQIAENTQTKTKRGRPSDVQNKRDKRNTPENPKNGQKNGKTRDADKAPQKRTRTQNADDTVTHPKKKQTKNNKYSQLPTKQAQKRRNTADTEKSQTSAEVTKKKRRKKKSDRKEGEKGICEAGRETNNTNIQIQRPRRARYKPKTLDDYFEEVEEDGEDPPDKTI